MKCYRRILKITWRKKVTDEFLWRKVIELLGERPESVLETIKRRKLKFYRYQPRKKTLAKMMIGGRVESSRGRGRSRQWEDDLIQ